MSQKSISGRGVCHFVSKQTGRGLEGVSFMSIQQMEYEECVYQKESIGRVKKSGCVEKESGGSVERSGCVKCSAIG